MRKFEVNHVTEDIEQAVSVWIVSVGQNVNFIVLEEIVV